MFDLIAILIPIVLAICIVVTIKIIEDARVRRRLIDAGADEHLARAILQGENEARRRGSTRWGAVLVLIGLAFAALAWLGLDAEDPLAYALVFGAAGLGLLTFRWLDPPAS